MVYKSTVFCVTMSKTNDPRSTKKRSKHRASVGGTRQTQSKKKAAHKRQRSTEKKQRDLAAQQRASLLLLQRIAAAHYLSPIEIRKRKEQSKKTQLKNQLKHRKSKKKRQKTKVKKECWTTLVYRKVTEFSRAYLDVLFTIVNKVFSFSTHFCVPSLSFFQVLKRTVKSIFRRR